MFRKTAAAAVLLTLAAVVPTPQAAAQDGAIGGAIVGGAIGGIIGGVATGRAGGAAAGAIIGGTTGAIIGSQSDRPRGGYFWSEGRCFYQYPNGQVVRAQRRYCM